MAEQELLFPLRVTCGRYEGHPQRVHLAQKRYIGGRHVGYETACGFFANFLGSWMSKAESEKRQCKRCERKVARV